MERPLPVPSQDRLPQQWSPSQESLASWRGQLPPGPPLSTATPVELPTLDFLGLFQIIARQKWLILLMLAAFLGLAILFLQNSPRIFESTGELEVRSSDPQVRPYETTQQEDLGSIDALKTVERNLQAPTLIGRMIQHHGLGESLKGSLASQIATISGHSNIQLVRGTRNVSISYRSPDPEYAQRVVKAYIEEFQKLRQEDKQRLEEASKEGLRKSEALFRQQLAEATQALEAFTKKHALLDLRTDGNIISDELADLSQRLNEAEAKRIELDKQLGSVSPSARLSELMEISSIAERNEIQSLLSTLHEKEAAFEALKKKRGPLHPEYRDAQSELETFTANMETAARKALVLLQRNYQQAREQEETYRSSLQQQQSEVTQREFIVRRYQELKNEADRLKTIHDGVVSKLYQTEVNAGLDTHIIIVREQPMLPEFPIWPNKPFILAGGMLVGLVSGLALAFALEALRRRVRTEADIHKLLPEANCLAILPPVKVRSPQDKIVLKHDPHSLAAEGFRNLRTSLHFRPEGEPKTLVFTSAQPGEGKSFCAINCATAYAMQGFQTLLIDADLRRPTLEETFLRGRNRGMTEYLRGRAEPTDICYPTQVQGLYLIPSGDLRPNPSELLAGQRLHELLVQASQFFEKIIIDSPPLLPVSDGLLLSGLADATCLVIRSNSTRKRDLTETRKLLRTTGQPIAGYILNGATQTQNNASYVNYLTKQQRLGLQERNMEAPTLPARAKDLSNKVALF